MKIVVMVEVYEVNVVLYNFYGYLCIMMNVYFLVVVFNLCIMEIDIDWIFWDDEFFICVLVFEDGYFIFDDMLGWGIEFNEDVVCERLLKIGLGFFVN